MLKYKADYRTLFLMLSTMALLIFLWINWPSINIGLFILLYLVYLILSVAASVMTHNHQHCALWNNKIMNGITDNWLTVFYGFPIFAWIPTHNVNHHRYVNTEPDDTRTYRYSEKNNILTLLTYPSVSGYFQQKSIGKYLKTLKSTNKKQYWASILQILTLVIWVGTALIIDWQKALLFVIIPQQFSMYSVLIFNYIQHVHADEEDDFNSSRNFTGGLLNFVLLNNGFHTAHHYRTSMHWSELPKLHDEIAPKIKPELNESNMLWFFVRVYILGSFSQKMRTKSMRLARIQDSK